jgi:hypothetical protein
MAQSVSVNDVRAVLLGRDGCEFWKNVGDDLLGG